MIKECNPQKDNELTYAEFEKMVSDMVDKEWPSVLYLAYI
jgi:hypothetical protein